MRGRPGEKLEYSLAVITQENRAAIAHGTSDQPWLQVGPTIFRGRSAFLPLTIAAVPARLGETLQAVVAVTANGGQHFAVPVKLAIGVPGPATSAPVAVPAPSPPVAKPAPIKVPVATPAPVRAVAPVAAIPAPPVRAEAAGGARSLFLTLAPALLLVATALGGVLHDWLVPARDLTPPDVEQTVDATPRLAIRFHDVTQNDVLDNLFLPDHQATMRFGLVTLQKGKEVGDGVNVLRLTFDPWGRTNNACVRFLGLLIALALGLVDALWIYAARQLWRAMPRVFVCVTIGTVGGLVGGTAGQLLFDEFENLFGFQIFGWVLTGLMVGASIGSYDLLRTWIREEELGFATSKLIRGVLGGAVGGLLGGILDWKLGSGWTDLFPAKENLWSPSLTGFIALGLCIGLLIAVAQVVLKDAWLKVEAGFRKGRELLISKPVLTIGRAESCDLGLFGDAMIEKLHARIYQQDGHYLIADNASAHGTFVNDQRVEEPTLLRTGDLIRVGNAYVRFSERRKQ